MIERVSKLFNFVTGLFSKKLLTTVPKIRKPYKKRRKKWNAAARAAASIRMKALFKKQRVAKGWTPEKRKLAAERMRAIHAERRIIGRVDAGVPSLGVSTNPMGH